MAAPAKIEWLAWSDEAFAHAAATQRPILLRIGATWCASCHLMAEECDADPLVVATVAEEFVRAFNTMQGRLARFIEDFPTPPEEKSTVHNIMIQLGFSFVPTFGDNSAEGGR